MESKKQRRHEDAPGGSSLHFAFVQPRGPALRTASGISNVASFSRKSFASFFAWASYAALSFQVFLGLRTSAGTPGTASGRGSPKYSSGVNLALARPPL